MSDALVGEWQTTENFEANEFLKSGAAGSGILSIRKGPGGNSLTTPPKAAWGHIQAAGSFTGTVAKATTEPLTAIACNLLDVAKQAPVDGKARNLFASRPLRGLVVASKCSSGFPIYQGPASFSRWTRSIRAGPVRSLTIQAGAEQNRDAIWTRAKIRNQTWNEDVASRHTHGLPRTAWELAGWSEAAEDLNRRSPLCDRLRTEQSRCKKDRVLCTQRRCRRRSSVVRISQKIWSTTLRPLAR